jgi:hypothetical protein
MEAHTCETIIDICRKVYEEQGKELALTAQRVRYDCKSYAEAEETMLLDESNR